MADDAHTCSWRLVASYYDEDTDEMVIGEICTDMACSGSQERREPT